jgi:hypothetical protein
MLHSDDVEGPLDQYEWVEYRVRLLQPKLLRPLHVSRTLDEWFQYHMNEALTANVLSQEPAGAAGRCVRCGLVTIKSTGYAGVARYPDPYCPHCDGGEDVG